jgi:ERCC4-type nuclease
MFPVSLIELLKEKLEKQLAAYDEKLEAAQAKARARKADAEASVAGAELEEQFLIEVNAIKDKMAEGQAYLKELSDAGEDKADEIKSKIASFFD